MQAEKPDHAETDVERLVLRGRPALVSIARSIVGDANEAEDVVQDTIVAALSRLADVEPEMQATYLREAVRRNALKLAARRREHAAPPDVVESLRGIDERDLPDPLELEEAIESLPAVQQTVLRMKYYMGLTFREIGIALSISSHTAASRCRYALSKLKKFFER